MPCMEYEVVTNFYLALKKIIFWAIKRLGYARKIRVGRVIGNKYLSFLGLLS